MLLPLKACLSRSCEYSVGSSSIFFFVCFFGVTPTQHAHGHANAQPAEARDSPQKAPLTAVVPTYLLHACSSPTTYWYLV